MRLLLVEDNPRIASSLAAALERERYVVDLLTNLEDGREAARSNGYDLAIVDRGLPDGSGVDLVRGLAARAEPPRILMLTVDGQASSKVEALDAGADDYLEKPFELDELLARLRALARRGASGRRPVVEAGALRFDPATRDLFVGTAPLHLPRGETLILETLMLRAERVVARDALVSAVYGLDDAVCSNSLDSQISRLRARLAKAEAGVRIHALRGLGYMLEAVASGRA